MNLQGKGALVTGGGTGVGRSVALALAREGCKVAVCGRREDKLVETAGLWEGEPPILLRAADVADRASVEALFGWADAELGPVHLLVNSAGMNIRNRTMADIDPADWDRVLQANATGAFNCIHAVLPQMRERKDGVIINISSVAGKRAGPLGGVAYNASKFAMSALGISVGAEDGKNGVRVSNVYPGEINTPILDDRPVKVSDEHKAQILQPEDVAAAVLMIARLPARASVPELVIKPTTQDYF
jgi:NAD(P)-dependent dehydrogenase (short-subunit alcohol dehydrogenase family)